MNGPGNAVAGECVLLLRDVTKRYGRLTALDGVSLQVRSGEIVAITGRSGSGKTTLLNVASSLSRPDEGLVQIAGADTTRRTDRELSSLRSHSIGLVFQRFHLAPGRTALANVADGLLYSGVPIGARRRRAEEALVAVGLGHRLGHRPHELSGGECQRVAIARAITRRPRVLFADEPTGNLDSESAEAVTELLRGLNAEGTAVIVVTHDQKYAASLPRQVVMADGRVVSDSGGAAGDAGVPAAPPVGGPVDGAPW